MKDLPKKKVVLKLEKEDRYLDEHSLSNEKKVFDKTESRLRKMMKAVKIRKPLIKKVAEVRKKAGVKKPAKRSAVSCRHKR